jgi:hypothetical protein
MGMKQVLSNRREMYHMGINICKNVCTLCPLYRPDQGNIVGRKYIHSCKFLYSYGTSLGDSTIVDQRFHDIKLDGFLLVI